MKSKQTQLKKKSNPGCKKSQGFSNRAIYMLPNLNLLDYKTLIQNYKYLFYLRKEEIDILNWVLIIMIIAYIQILGLYDDSAKCFEMSLTIFNYIEKIHYDNALEHDYYFIEYNGQNNQEIILVKDHKLKLCVNLAACYLKIKLFQDCLKACDLALDIDKNQVKAYFRRAQAKQLLNYNLNDSLLDYQKANILDPSNNEIKREILKINCMLKKQKLNIGLNAKLISPEKPIHQINNKPTPAKLITDAQLQKQKSEQDQKNLEAKLEQESQEAIERNKLSSKSKQQNQIIDQIERTAGRDLKQLLESPNINPLEKQVLSILSQYNDDSSSSSESEQEEIVNEEMTNEQVTQFWKQFNIHKDYENQNFELSYEEDLTKEVPNEVYELGNFIEGRGNLMLKQLEALGQYKEASLLREKLKKAVAAKSQLEKISRLDFNRPKQHLLDIANKFGIDLLKESVKNEFRRIQQQNIQDIRTWLDLNTNKHLNYQSPIIKINDMRQNKNKNHSYQIKIEIKNQIPQSNEHPLKNQTHVTQEVPITQNIVTKNIAHIQPDINVSQDQIPQLQGQGGQIEEEINPVNVEIQTVQKENMISQVINEEKDCLIDSKEIPVLKETPEMRSEIKQTKDFQNVMNKYLSQPLQPQNYYIYLLVPLILSIVLTFSIKYAQ